MLSILFDYQVFVISYILHLFTPVVIEIKDTRNMYKSLYSMAQIDRNKI